MFILWAFSLKERTDCYASETFAVMGHNLRKHLDMLDYCPSTPSPFHVHSCSFGNSFQSPVFKYYLCNENSYICIYNLEHPLEFQTHQFTCLLDMYTCVSIQITIMNIAKETELLILSFSQICSDLVAILISVSNNSFISVSHAKILDSFFIFLSSPHVQLVVRSYGLSFQNISYSKQFFNLFNWSESPSSHS